jgi:predicted glycoside hydrolase/deacetylase ChbG (UPF0249 family)
MIKIYFHADDIGLSKSITNHILDSIDNGFINRTSIIVNGTYSSKAATELNKRKLTPYLHLNLTEGKPLSNNENLNQFISKHGQFNNSFLSLDIKWLLARKTDKQKLSYAITNEIKSQIIKFKKLFPSEKKIKLDGHQNIHLSPLVFRQILSLTKEYNVVELRLPSERYESIFKSIFIPNLWINILKSLVLNFLFLFYSNLLEKHLIFYERNFHGTLFTGVMNEKYLTYILKKYKKTSEKNASILFHPGYSSKNEKYLWHDYRRWLYYNSQSRLNEYSLVKNKKLIKKIMK